MAVSAANSLVGTTASDQVGLSGAVGVKETSSGNYLVLSPLWDNVAATATNAGAITWVNGSNGQVYGGTVLGATVSAANTCQSDP